MSRLLQTVVALLLACLPALAQETDRQRELNQKAIEALQAKRFDDGIQLLMQILELVPKDKGTAYNLACAHALKGDVDGGFRWLEQSGEWGWGSGSGTLLDTRTRLSEIDMCKQDPDLESLRKDPRWEALLAKLEANLKKREARLKAGELYGATPAVYVPEAAKALAEKPVLVVVHDVGSTKDQVASGFWKEVADELGFVLVAPSGRIPLGETPAEKGMAWFEADEDYRANKDAWRIEKPIHEAIASFKKTEKIDRARVVLVGDGGMGTLVAFGAGLSSAGLYKAVLGVDGLFDGQTVKDKGPAAAKMGQRATLLIEASLLGDDAAAAQRVVDGASRLLSDAKLGTVRTYPLAKDDPKARVKLVAETVRGLLAAPAAAPASAPVPK